MGSALAACGEYVSKGSLVLMYALCSASMLIVNKWALLHFPVPAMVTLLQCGSTALIVVLVRATGLLKVEPVSWSVVRSFLSVPVLFALALYTSSQLLHYADAGLQILIRTTTPVVVCIADHLIMGYELPSARSAAALFGLLGGAAFYFRIETHITPAAVFWGALYFISISVEMVWVKSVINRVPMSTWIRVLITNAVTALFLTPFCLLQPERGKLVERLRGTVPPTLVGAAAVTTSCIAGFALSFFGFKLRESVSATTFTFVGVVCKFATVLVNQMIWVHHGSSVGAAVLCTSILLSTMYVAPKKVESAYADTSEKPSLTDPARGRLQQIEAADVDDDDAHDENSMLVVRSIVAEPVRGAAGKGAHGAASAADGGPNGDERRASDCCRCEPSR